VTSRFPVLLGALLTVAASALLAQEAGATVMLRLDVRALVARSDQIVLADVVRQRVLELQGRLWTESLLRVRQTYKGGARRGAMLAVRQLGGERGNKGLRVAGVATFMRGERALVYLRRVDGYYVVVGMAQGKYRAFRDGAGVWRAVRDLSGVAFALPARGRTLVVLPLRVVGAPARKLGAVVAELRRVLTTRGAASRARGAR